MPRNRSTFRNRHRFREQSKKLELGFGQVPHAKASGGIGTRPCTIEVQINGDCPPAETIANLFATLRPSTLGKK
jgi:hypothetical protein